MPPKFSAKDVVEVTLYDTSNNNKPVLSLGTLKLSSIQNEGGVYACGGNGSKTIKRIGDSNGKADI
ncbi:hypothetical protein M5X02_30705 [Paenibacillus alvei]|uniref:hypothetical protein n=1 Tax=Paenibacillus alvei TaxID=44250 RepID=UPI0012F96956|nr:hypothetical protein [Paenibacillus alvei]MCY9544998.1 hypothetical protein [Paenibacillus alvei]MCY9707687.1 hypothetical protein [Paenibacillus alvei]MEC0082800.1 hypothetical protein [Paenibacillus alvei]